MPLSKMISFLKHDFEQYCFSYFLLFNIENYILRIRIVIAIAVVDYLKLPLFMKFLFVAIQFFNYSIIKALISNYCRILNRYAFLNALWGLIMFHF